MAGVSLKNITKVFDGKVTAVDNVTLDVADREFMVIVGSSGCGKSTTLRMIAGLEEPTSGMIAIDGRVVNRIPPKDRDIAMVFQNYALYPHMTVFQNMAFGLKLRKCPRAEINRRVQEAANLLGIEQLLDRKPKALSGGQRQRTAVGRAIVRNPKVFLFDEPLSNLDAKLRLAARVELKSLHKRLQTTTIYVTHDQAEAMTLGDRICVMHNGVIQQFARPMDVYNHPVNRFVAGFLGSPAMNFFNGTIQFKGDNVYCVIGDDIILLRPRMRAILAAYKDKQIVFGIRPEHLSTRPINGQSGNTISCTVEMLEFIGDRIDLCLKNNQSDNFIARMDSGVDINVGRPLTMYIDLDKVHIFEQGEMGKNVGLDCTGL